MIIRNTSNKIIGIGVFGTDPVRILPDEEAFVPDEAAQNNGTKTLQRMGLIEIRPEPKLDKDLPVADELPVQPRPAEEIAEAPKEEAAAAPAEKAPAKKTSSKRSTAAK